MRRRPMLPLIAAAMALLMLPGCATVVSNLTSKTSAQVTSLAEAEQAATLATRAADIYVITRTPSREQLLRIKALSDAVHAALGDLERANARGESLIFASFTTALDALRSYRATPTSPPISAAIDQKAPQ